MLARSRNASLPTLSSFSSSSTPRVSGLSARSWPPCTGKTFPGTDGARALTWYRHAATFADRSGDIDTRVWVRGRAAIALGYEGASLDAADQLAEQAIALDEQPSLGRLNAVMGKAHVAAIRGDSGTAMALLDEGRRAFDAAGSDDAESDYAVPWWRFNVFISLMAARLGEEHLALQAQDEAARTLPESLPRFRTHLEMHRGLMLVRRRSRRRGGLRPSSTRRAPSGEALPDTSNADDGDRTLPDRCGH